MAQIYYKAFNRELKCSGFQYKEGDIFEIDRFPVLCELGFHFCKELVLTLESYPVENITANKYAEVEILGDVVFEEPTKHKGVTNKIKIVRVLTDKEVLKLVDKNFNSGYSNSGDYNSGDYNSGDWNSGDKNSGDKNSGNCNSGYKNSGNYNSGYRNSGYKNSGNYNSGYKNSGNRNSGYYNSGDWNSTSYESGYFNTLQSKKIRVFNKEIDRKLWENSYKPKFLFFELIEGKSYKESFISSWEKSDKEDRIKVKELPGFDSEIFYEISGIDLRK